MPKITVRDVLKEFHTYKGDDIKFFINDLGVEIVKFAADDTPARKLAQFAHGQYLWVKEDDREAGGLQSHPSGAEMNATEVKARIEKWSQDTVRKLQADADPFTAAARAGAAPLAPDFETLRADYGKKIISGPPVKIGPVLAHVQADDPATIKQVYDKLAQQEPAPADKPKRKRIRPSRAKPKVPGMETSTTIIENIYPVPSGPISTRPSPPAPDCETCAGTGLIRDGESADPLDTVQCPDC